MAKVRQQLTGCGFFPLCDLLCGLDSKGRGREERAQHGGKSDFREVHLLELGMDLVHGWAGMRWFCRSRAVKEGRNVAGALHEALFRKRKLAMRREPFIEILQCS